MLMKVLPYRSKLYNIIFKLYSVPNGHYTSGITKIFIYTEKKNSTVYNTLAYSVRLSDIPRQACCYINLLDYSNYYTEAYTQIFLLYCDHISN